MGSSSQARPGNGGMFGAGRMLRPEPYQMNSMLRPQFSNKQMAGPVNSMGGMGAQTPNMPGMSGPQQIDVGGGKMAQQFGQGPNQFMWGGGQGTAPVLDALGNPANANFLGNIGGRRWFGPSDGGGNSW